jgi:hypothetical protein
MFQLIPVDGFLHETVQCQYLHNSFFRLATVNLHIVRTESGPTAIKICADTVYLLLLITFSNWTRLEAKARIMTKAKTNESQGYQIPFFLQRSPLL